jgi:hypothetical protein
MKATTFLLLVTFSLLGLGGCSNSTPNDPIFALPPETQTGANTFGCYINGKLLIPRDGTGTIGGSDDGARFWGGYPLETSYYEFDIRDFKSIRTASILIHLKEVHVTGISNYIIDLSNGMRGIDGLNHNYIHCRIFNESTNSYQYYRSFDNSGIVSVKRYDFNNRIVSGTFTCRLRNSINPTDEIEIIQGRFDFKWDVLSDKIFP